MYYTVVHCEAYAWNSFISQQSSSLGEYLTHKEKILCFYGFKLIQICYSLNLSR